MSVPPGMGRGMGKDSRDNLPRGQRELCGGHCLLPWCLGIMGTPLGLRSLASYSGGLEQVLQAGN